MGKGSTKRICHSYTFGTFLAVVADVSVSEKEVHIDKMFVAVDYGTAINPDVIKAQIPVLDTVLVLPFTVRLISKWRSCGK